MKTDPPPLLVARILFYSLSALAGALVLAILGLGIGQLVELAVQDNTWRLFAAASLAAWFLLIAAAILAIKE